MNKLKSEHTSNVRLCAHYFLRLFTISFLLLSLLAPQGLALNLGLDTSVDDEIRRKYNPTKLEEDVGLPSLPKILNEKEYTPQEIISSTKKPTLPSSAKQKIVVTKNTSTTNPKITKIENNQNYAVIKKGTKIHLTIKESISDKTTKGTRLHFTSRYPVTTTYFTIPAETSFTGEIIASHRPQLGGNGGLIVINVDGVNIDGKTIPITSNVTRANSKFIFFNNIKGKRRYLAGMRHSMKPGARFLRKMLRVTGRLAGDGASIFVAPFSLAIGVFGAAGNVAISPALALFYKGSTIYLKEGSAIDIKLVDDMYIYR